MRRPSLVLGSLVVGLLFVPGALAHVSITAVAPTEPLPVDVATKIATTVSASCVDVVAEYTAAGKTEFELGVKDPPAWLSVKGDKIPFKADMCGTDGNVKSTGNVELTPGPLAPGLEEIMITIIPKGETAEVKVPITVAYRGLLNVSGPETPEIQLEGGQATVDLELNATLNADSMVMIEVTTPPEFGTLNIPSSLDLTSPIAEGQSSRIVPFQFGYLASPGTNFTMDMVSVRFVMHSVVDPGAAAEPIDMMFHFMVGEHGLNNETEHDHATHDHGDGAGVPGLDASLLLAGTFAAALLWRRRRA